MANKCICGNIATVIGIGGQSICRSCDWHISKREWDTTTLDIIHTAGQKVFRYYWLHKDEFEDGVGTTVAEAFKSLGYGDGALRALDYYEEIIEDNHGNLRAGCPSQVERS